MDSLSLGALFAHRAAIMHEWKGEESYTVFMLMLQDLLDKDARDLIDCEGENFRSNIIRGRIRAIREVMKMADRAIHEHQLHSQRNS